MNRTGRAAAVVAVCVLGVGCLDFEQYYSRKPPPVITPAAPQGRLLRASRGAAIDISNDDTRVVAVNRDARSVSVFQVDYARTPIALVRVKEVRDVCNEPWQVVINPGGDKAYVVCRKDQRVVPLNGINTADPVAGAPVTVGSEPTGLALSPLGKSLWVANWVDGTLSVIDTVSMHVTEVDLNPALAATYLGGAKSRRGLAHPRSVAISNNGDDIELNEFAYVTEYFSQQKEPLQMDGSNADTARVGVVYKIPLSPPFAVETIELPPAPMGFKDTAGDTAQCFPNQLQSITVNGAFGYVTSICASPKGPLLVTPSSTPAAKACGLDSECPGGAVGACDTTKSQCTTNCVQNGECPTQQCINNVCTDFSNVKTRSSPAVTILKLAEKKTFGTEAMNIKFWSAYGSAVDETSRDRRLPLGLNDVAFLDAKTALLTAAGADSVVRVDFNENYLDRNIDGVGYGPRLYIDLSKTGAGPIGLTMTHQPHPTKESPRYAFVANDATRNVSVIDVASGQTIGEATESSPMPLATSEEGRVATGKRLFNTGLGRWSLNEQAWGSCADCHVDGLTDNITWFFPRGPRQSISIDGSFEKKPSGEQRIFGWNASSDEASDLDSNVIRNFLGGVGAIVKNDSVGWANRIPFEKKHGGLNGSSTAAANPKDKPADLADASAIDDWAAIVSYLRTIRPPRRPSQMVEGAIDRGRAVAIDAGCHGCHAGPLWTTSMRFYTPDKSGALGASLKTASWDTRVANALFPPSLLPVGTASSRTMRYNGSEAGKFDSLWCALRPVGTFGAAEPGVVVVERRQDMKDVAQGDATDGRGYSPPSLFGLSVGAPFFHAGNARTLEAALVEFPAHRDALAGRALTLTPEKIDDLVQYLLSIDGDAPVVAVPTLGKQGGSFCAQP